MNNLATLILDLLHSAKLKNQVLTIEGILKHVPEQLRTSARTGRDIQKVLKRFCRGRLAKAAKGGYILTTFRK